MHTCMYICINTGLIMFHLHTHVYKAVCIWVSRRRNRPSSFPVQRRLDFIWKISQTACLNGRFGSGVFLAWPTQTQTVLHGHLKEGTAGQIQYKCGDWQHSVVYASRLRQCRDTHTTYIHTRRDVHINSLHFDTYIHTRIQICINTVVCHLTHMQNDCGQICKYIHIYKYA